MDVEEKKKETIRWRNLALGITVVGLLVVAIPWEPAKLKIYAALPLYAMFVYVYYRYLCLKRAGKNNTAEATGDSSPAALAVEQGKDNGKGKGKGKKPKKQRDG